MGTAESKEGEKGHLFREPSDLIGSPHQGTLFPNSPLLANITPGSITETIMQSTDDPSTESLSDQPSVKVSTSPIAMETDNDSSATSTKSSRVKSQSHGHIPVNPMPGPPYHKIAQPARQPDPAPAPVKQSEITPVKQQEVTEREPSPDEQVEAKPSEEDESKPSDPKQQAETHREQSQSLPDLVPDPLPDPIPPEPEEDSEPVAEEEDPEPVADHDDSEPMAEDDNSEPMAVDEESEPVAEPPDKPEPAAEPPGPVDPSTSKPLPDSQIPEKKPSMVQTTKFKPQPKPEVHAASYQEAFAKSVVGLPEEDAAGDKVKVASGSSQQDAAKVLSAPSGDSSPSPEPSGDAKATDTPEVKQMTAEVPQKSAILTPPSDSAPSEASDPVSPSPQITTKVKKNLNSSEKSTPATRRGLPPAPQSEPTLQRKRQIIPNVRRGYPYEIDSPKASTLAQRKDTAKAAKIGHLPKGPQVKQVVLPTEEKPCEWLVGDLVWSKVSGHPWWPCMVAYDPIEGIYTRMKGSGGRVMYRMYHVQFFGDVPERGWVSGSSMKKFTGRDEYDTLIQDMVNKVPKKERSKLMAKLSVKPARRPAWEVAVTECLSALPMSRHDRKLNFTFKYENPKAGPGAETIDPLTLGDSPKMKAKRAFKKQSETTPSGNTAATASAQTSTKKTPKGKKETQVDSTPKRKRGRKTAQFLEFSSQNKETILKENPGISQSEIYTKLEEKWDGLTEDEREKYASKGSVSPKAKPERKRKISTPEIDPESAPVVKRSKRESRPSKKLQEADLSSLGYSPKAVASIKKYSDSSQSESQESDTTVTSPKTPTPKASTPAPAPAVPALSNVVKTTPGSSGKGRQRKSDAAPTPPPVPTGPGKVKGRPRKSDAAITPTGPARGKGRPRKSDVASPAPATPVLPSAGSEQPPKRKRSTKTDANGGATISDMGQDFAEMQADDEDGGLVLDTNLIAGALQTAVDPKGLPISSTSSETDASSLHGGSTTESVTGSTHGGRERSAGGGAAKKENVCQVCESPGQLLLCEGGCCGAFHLDCIGLQTEPTGTFKCDECISGVHSCYMCKVQDQEVKRCHVSVCGKYYHEDCIRKFPLTRFDNRGFTCPLHTCVACFADNPKGTKASKGRLMRCVRCPTAYHQGESCVAAGSIVLAANSIVCSRHFQPIKSHKHHSHVSVAWCFDCSLGGDLLICCESCPAAYHPKCLGLDSIPEGNWYCRDCLNGKKPRYGDIVWVKLGNYRWWPGLVCNPKDVPQNIQDKTHQVGEFPVLFFGSNDYFWTHQGRVFEYHEGDKGSKDTATSKGLAAVFKAALKEASERFKVWKASKEQKIAKELEHSSKKPAPFKFIKSNRPVGNVVMPPFDITRCQACECTPDMDNPCGPDSDCLNRILLIECHPNVCPAKDKCQNQRFQKRAYPESVPMKVEGRGWGLVTLVDIKKGDFVNEYVGELVDEEECRQRIKNAHDENIVDFYFLTIEKDRIIDAGPKGNLSRFMNHSCQPNCETQKWTVNGDTRVGLFAIKNIPTGSELSFNYNLDCLGNEKKKCQCGAPNCSGLIGVRPKTAAAAANEERSKQAKDNKKKKRIRKKHVIVKHEDECFRCGEGGELVMCDVKECPKSYHLTCLGLTKHPYGKWQCPWHHCDICGKPATVLCDYCPNSYCKVHCTGATVVVYDKHFCHEHDVEEMQRMEEEKMKLAKLRAEADALAKKMELEKMEKKARRKSKGEGDGEKKQRVKKEEGASGSDGSDSKSGAESKDKTKDTNKVEVQGQKKKIDVLKIPRGKTEKSETTIVKDTKESVADDLAKVNGTHANESEEEDDPMMFNADSDAELVIDETVVEKKKPRKRDKDDKVSDSDSSPSSSPKKKKKKDKKEKKHKKDKDKKKEKKDKKEKEKSKETKMKEREKLLQKLSSSIASSMVNGS